MVKVPLIEFVHNHKGAMPAHSVCALALLPSLSDVSEAISHAAGDLAQSVAGFSDQLPVLAVMQFR